MEEVRGFGSVSMMPRLIDISVALLSTWLAGAGGLRADRFGVARNDHPHAGEGDVLERRRHLQEDHHSRSASRPARARRSCQRGSEEGARGYPEAVQVKLTSPFRFKGKEVTPDAKGQYPVGTTVRYEAAYRSPMIVSLVRRPEGWRIDLRWWLAMMEMQRGPGPREGTPDYAVRALTASLVSLDCKSAAMFATPGANLDLLFTGAPRQREPSGVYEALVGEMPLVEMGPASSARCPRDASSKAWSART